MDASNDALNLNAGNTKALFRRANAYANLNFIDEAIDTLNIAHQIDPNDEVNFKSTHFNFVRKPANYRLCHISHTQLERLLVTIIKSDIECSFYGPI